MQTQKTKNGMGFIPITNLSGWIEVDMFKSRSVFAISITCSKTPLLYNVEETVTESLF